VQKFAEMDVNQHFGKPPCTRLRLHAFKHYNTNSYSTREHAFKHNTKRWNIVSPSLTARGTIFTYKTSTHTAPRPADHTKHTYITQEPMNTSQIYKPNLHHNHMHSVARRVWDVGTGGGKYGWFSTYTSRNSFPSQVHEPK
jgi:hypothetical protein